MAIIKVSGVLILEKETVKLSSQQEVITEYQSSNESMKDNILDSSDNSDKDNLETENEQESGSIGNTSTNLAVNSNSLTELTVDSMVSAGNTFGVALKTDKTALIWGYNNYGQQAIVASNTTNQTAPID